MSNPSDRSKTVIDWLIDASGHDIVTDDDPLIEANANLHRWFLTQDAARLLTVDALSVAVSEVATILSDKLELDHCIKGMIFYVWFDSMSGSMCWSLISVREPVVLPFSGVIKNTGSISDVVAMFLQSAYLEGICYDELSMVDREEYKDVDVPQLVTVVYSIGLPVPPMNRHPLFGL